MNNNRVWPKKSITHDDIREYFFLSFFSYEIIINSFTHSVFMKEHYHGERITESYCVEEFHFFFFCISILKKKHTDSVV